MSRSYKKYPYYTDGSPGTTKEMKRFANKKVRQYKKDINKKGNSYKKIFETYDIHDWISRWSWEEAKAEYENNDGIGRYSWKDDYLTLKDFRNFWSKYYKRK